jgi:hypothetical protein
MKVHRITTPETASDFEAARNRALEVADEQLGDNMMLSWYDRERHVESPSHASECHEGCEVKGYWDYALNRGGSLAVDVDEGRFVFCFRTL